MEQITRRRRIETEQLCEAVAAEQIKKMSRWAIIVILLFIIGAGLCL